MDAPPKKEEATSSGEQPQGITYRGIRDKYDAKFGLKALSPYQSSSGLDCRELARFVNQQSALCIKMMKYVQSRGDLGCTFDFQPAATLCRSLNITLERRKAFDHLDLKEAFAAHVSLLHVTSGDSTLEEFLLQKAPSATPRRLDLLHTESILLPNYVCQVFLEQMCERAIDPPIKLGATEVRDWTLFGNNMSVFFSLVLNNTLVANNAGQKTQGKKAVFKPFCEFDPQLTFWIGPDLLSLSSAYKKDPDKVRRIVRQTVAPYGTPKEILDLLFWRAVASKFPAITVEDMRDGSEALLRMINTTNSLNLNGVREGGDAWTEICDSNKLEIKALGLVSGIEKIPLSRLALKYIR